MILRETTSEQSLKLTPSDNNITSIDITNQSSGVTTTYTVSEVFLNSYFVQINLVLDLKENNDYILKAKNSADEVVYYTTVFCTNQIISDFTINKDEYTQRSSDNEYIIYE